MAVPDIYPLAFLNDRLITKEAVTVSLQRNEELSGSGDGRMWRAELARPLWTATMTLSAYGRNCRARAREIDAKFRALGVGRTFLWTDPTYKGPTFGATPELAQSTVTIATINEKRTGFSLSGLPPGYALNPGDRVGITVGETRFYMAEFVEQVTANASGVTGVAEVYPYLPLGISIGATVELIRPAIRMMLAQDGYTPFSYITNFVAQGASLTLLQKV